MFMPDRRVLGEDVRPTLGEMDVVLAAELTVENKACEFWEKKDHAGRFQ